MCPLSAAYARAQDHEGSPSRCGTRRCVRVLLATELGGWADRGQRHGAPLVRDRHVWLRPRVIGSRRTSPRYGSTRLAGAWCGEATSSDRERAGDHGVRALHCSAARRPALTMYERAGLHALAAADLTRRLGKLRSGQPLARSRRGVPRVKSRTGEEIRRVPSRGLRRGCYARSTAARTFSRARREKPWRWSIPASPRPRLSMRLPSRGGARGRSISAHCTTLQRPSPRRRSIGPRRLTA